MEKVSLLLEETINENLVRVIISNKRKSMEIQKVVIHPFLKNDKLLFQFEAFRGKQVFHDNREKQDAVCEMFRLLSEDFKQMEMETKTEKITVLVSKKGKATIRRKQEIICNQVKDLSHNRKKEYLLPAKDVPFLVELGITTRDGKVIDKKYKKYRQINRFLEFIQDILPKLPKNKKLTIVDFGCGKSYLTFAMYYYLKI